MSKIGVHVVIGPRNGFGPFLQRIAGAGQTIAVVKCVDDFGSALEAKNLMPNTLTVGRVNELFDRDGNRVDLQGFQPLQPDGSLRNPREIAEWVYGLVRPKWLLNPHIDVWETFNEFSAHWGWQSDFYLAMMDLAERDGFKLAHYACSTGNPPDAAAAREMLPCLRAAKQRGHYLSLHEYGGVGTDIQTLRGTQPFHALRYRALYETILIPNDADPPLIISECGQAGGFNFLGSDTLVEDMRWYDSELFKDDYVVGAAIFTLGNWFNSNFQAALPALAEYIATTPTPPAPPRQPRPEPAPPPPPARPRGAPRAQYQRTYLLLPNEPATPEGNARYDAWLRAVMDSGMLTRFRWTVGGSADDAGIGDLDNRIVIAINPETWPGSLADFFAAEYPGVVYDSLQAATPEELRVKLASHAFG
jgi:hypothetical protein